mmetsp:Transcript_78618/g.218286  ORF Transcript_78618/g.218286 Transcript_78618/m.218286 type:complete len:923 (-) Transcript_78618:190-2958(-)
MEISPSLVDAQDFIDAQQSIANARRAWEEVDRRAQGIVRQPTGVNQGVLSGGRSARFRVDPPEQSRSPEGKLMPSSPGCCSVPAPRSPWAVKAEECPRPVSVLNRAQAFEAMCSSRQTPVPAPTGAGERGRIRPIAPSGSAGNTETPRTPCISSRRLLADASAAGAPKVSTPPAGPFFAGHSLRVTAGELDHNTGPWPVPVATANLRTKASPSQTPAPLGAMSFPIPRQTETATQASASFSRNAQPASASFSRIGSVPQIAAPLAATSFANISTPASAATMGPLLCPSSSAPAMVSPTAAAMPPQAAPKREVRHRNNQAGVPLWWQRAHDAGQKTNDTAVGPRDNSACSTEDQGACSSSSQSPPRRQPASPAVPKYRRPRRSSGLVYSPGSAMVECVQSKAEMKFRLGTGDKGEQTLVPMKQEDVGEIHGGAVARRQIQFGTPFKGAFTPRSMSPPPVPKQVAPGELFAQFLTADSVQFTCGVFAHIMQCVGVEARADGPRGDLPYRRIQKLCGGVLPWRARSIWSLLDTRLRDPAYGQAPLARTSAVVCGAGPCGLRAALELALLGASPTVVEKRAAAESCNRINRIHLWEWCKLDLLAWGAKVFDPPGGTFGGDNDFCHIGIGELQLLLLKNALLLGVQFLFETEAKDIESKTLVCKNGSRLPCEVLISAGGASSPLNRVLGFRAVLLGLRGKGSAIGVVANFVNNRDARQMALRQFSWARQFNLPLFAKLERETSVNLENIVYYKGPTHHYLVMTPTRTCLVEEGVLKDGRASQQLLHGSNVDVQRLSSMVKRVAAFFDLPTKLCESQGAMIFDFSGVQRLESPAAIVDGVFVCAVGDALLEPFWPEGLGIVRGFMSALDAAAAAILAAAGRGDAAVAQVAHTFNILKSVAAQTAGTCLHKDPRQYGLNPNTRYVWAHA